MKFKYIILSAWDAIRAHKSRSLLTILGIVIGVAAIIIVMSLGRGASNLILGEISQIGAETIIVLPGETGGFDISDVLFSEGLTQRDLDALRVRSNAPNLAEIMPAAIVPGGVTYRGESYNRATILGGSADFFGATFNAFPSEGSLFTETDIQSRTRTVLIGRKVKEELFGPSDAVGEFVSIRGTQFRVAGVYPWTGQRAIFNIDDIVIMPYSTAQTYILGTNYFDRFIIKADDPVNVDKLEFDITATLRESRGINPGADEDFSVMTQQALIDQVSTIIGILTAFLSLVVAISLVVGGIGIMNIMLVSVTERTREIGLRKALGATRGAILKQFLWEAVILTVIGGFIGVIIGGVISYIASLILAETIASGWSFSFPVGAALLGIGVSAGVGLIFGLYPAKRASDKSPIEALRYE